MGRCPKSRQAEFDYPRGYYRDFHAADTWIVRTPGGQVYTRDLLESGEYGYRKTLVEESRLLILHWNHRKYEGDFFGPETA